jgi:4-amino-4-deoxy-L-arabinose transferase-like glycosyltransferase
MLILVMAAGIRLVWVLYTPALPVSDFEIYNQIAHQILNGKGLTATFVGPGYPFSLSVVYSWFGDSLTVPKIFNVVLGIFTCWLTYLIAKKCLNHKIALIAAGVVAFLPSYITYSGILASENLFTPLLLLGAYFFLVGIEFEKRYWLRLVLSGISIGLASLVRPIALLVPASWLIYLFINHTHFGKAVLVALVVGFVTLLTISPWLVRNYRISGSIVLQTEGGITFLIGNHILANGRYVREIPAEWQKEVKSLGLNEFQADSLAYQQAFLFIKERPLRWVSLIPLKWFHLLKRDDSGVYWNFQSTSRPFPPILETSMIVLADAYYYFVILSALISLGFLKSSSLKPKGYTFPLVMIIYWLIFHAFFFGMDRFHFPLMPFIAMFSGIGVYGIWTVMMSRRSAIRANIAT